MARTGEGERVGKNTTELVDRSRSPPISVLCPLLLAFFLNLTMPGVFSWYGDNDSNAVSGCEGHTVVDAKTGVSEWHCFRISFDRMLRGPVLKVFPMFVGST